MKFNTVPLLFAAPGLAFPQLRGMRRNQPGGVADSSLTSNFLRSLEGQNNLDDTQRRTSLDLSAQFLGNLERKRDLVGSILPPLTGILAGIDVPTPQPDGLVKVPDEDHPYIAPGEGDIRGACPALNTLANHGYISRNGITTFAEASNAAQTAFAIGYDFATFLSLVGLETGGDLATGKYSIGGQVSTDLVPATIGPAYGVDSHGRFEGDVSITRWDAYFGNNHVFNLSRWEQLVGYADEFDNGLFSIETFKQEVSIRWEESQAENPEFYSGIRDTLLRYGARILVFTTFPNGTTPTVADYANVAPFFLNETFPENWYRGEARVSLAQAIAGILEMYLYAPKPLGQNVNGAFAPFALQGPETIQDVQCFLFATAMDNGPGQTNPEILYLNEIATQIIHPLFGGTCNNTLFASAPGPAGQNSGSGSGIPMGSPYNQ